MTDAPSWQKVYGVYIVLSVRHQPPILPIYNKRLWASENHWEDCCPCSNGFWSNTTIRYVVGGICWYPGLLNFGWRFFDIPVARQELLHQSLGVFGWTGILVRIVCRIWPIRNMAILAQNQNKVTLFACLHIWMCQSLEWKIGWDLLGLVLYLRSPRIQKGKSFLEECNASRGFPLSTWICWKTLQMCLLNRTSQHLRVCNTFPEDGVVVSGQEMGPKDRWCREKIPIYRWGPLYTFA